MIVAVKKWIPSLHPRDKNGRFTRSRSAPASRAEIGLAEQITSGLRPKKGIVGTKAPAYLEPIAPAAHRQAVASYVAGGYVDTHKALRAGKTGDPSVTAMDAAMVDLPDDVMLSRRVPVAAFGPAGPDGLVGMRVRDAAYAPTSVGTVRATKGDVRMRISAPAGTRAAVNPETGEVILGRDLDMVVTKVEANSAGGYDMHVAVLSKKGAEAGKGDEKALDGPSADAPAEQAPPTARPSAPAKTAPPPAEKAPAADDASSEQPEGADQVRADLMKNRVPELQAMMRERGLRPGRLRKSQLVDALVADEMGTEGNNDREAGTPQAPGLDRGADSQGSGAAKADPVSKPSGVADENRRDVSVPGPAGGAEPATPADQIMDAIHDALTADGRKPGDLVLLAKVRDQLPGMSREDADAELRRLDRARRIRLEPDPARGELSQAELDAAIVIGPEPKHLISTNEPDRRGNGGDTSGPAAEPAAEPAAVQNSENPENQLPAAPPSSALAPETPTTANVPDAPTAQPGGPLPRVMSTQPLSDNKWGADPDSPVAFHADGEIGQAVGMLGADRMLDVDGLPLAEHLGRMATDTVMGRLPAQAQLDQLKMLAGRLPDGPGKRAVQLAVIGLDAPDGPAPEVPDSTPDALRKLMDQLWAIPLVRRDGMETDALSQALAKWDKGGMSGRRLADQVRQKAHNRRHESREGKLEIDTAVARAVADLEAQYADPDRRDDLKPDVIRDKRQQGLSAGEGAAPQTAPQTPSGPAPSETTAGTGLPTPAQPAVPAPASAEIDRAAVSAAIPKGPHRPGNDLTDTQRAGLEGYQDSRNGTDFKRINGALRTGGPGNAQTQKAIAGIDDAMTGSELNADITVLRGIRQSRAMFGDRLDGDLTGMRWREDGFLSTSTDTGAIAPFSRGEDPVQMRVAVPAGTKAIDLYDPRDPSEAEILIDRGHEIEVVTDRGVVDGIRQIDVRVLPKAGAGQQAGKQEAAPAPARAGGNGTAVPAGQETPAAGPAPGGVVSGGMTASGWDAAAKKAAQGQGGLDSVPVRFGSGIPISVPSGWSESQSAVIGDALATYQGEAFSEINSYLRGTADGGPEITDVVKKIDDAMAASPLPKDVLVYRTIKDPGKIFGDAWGPDVTGMEWEDSAFASTTADVRVASQFAQVAQMEEPDMPPVMMRILLPKGSPGVQVSPMGRPDEVWLDFQHEAEILTARGQRRRVVADRGVDENGIRVLDIEVIA